VGVSVEGLASATPPGPPPLRRRLVPQNHLINPFVCLQYSANTYHSDIFHISPYALPFAKATAQRNIFVSSVSSRQVNYHTSDGTPKFRIVMFRRNTSRKGTEVFPMEVPLDVFSSALLLLFGCAAI
jgi:hypothetical protein